MKKRIIVTFLVMLIMMFWANSLALAQKSPRDDFDFSRLRKIEMPDIKQAELKNGMKLLLVEDHQYPTIDLRAMIGVGSIYEPEDKIGLAAVTGTVLRTGGTETMSGDDIDQILETLGARVETKIGQNSGYVYVSVLKEDIGKGIDILSDILMHPAFAEDKIKLARIEQRAMISRRNDNVWSISNREFSSIIYGKSSPYARYPEYATIDAISRDDIVSFYEKYFHPNNIIFAAWGDFKTADMRKQLETAFAAWQPEVIEFPSKPKVDYQYKQSVHFVQKSDLNQTNIQMGHIGGMLDNPDYPALTVMNQILSYDRMFKVIRAQEGLTYAPWGYYGAQFDHPGVFNCGTQTKSATTVYAIRMMLDEVKRMTQEEVTDEELARAKDAYLNGYVFNFDSKEKIIQRMMTYAYFDYPMDFIERTKNGIEKVSKADVLRVAQTYLRPDELQILVVGKQEDFDEPLSTLGQVHEIDITIPHPKAETPVATRESLAKGRQWLEKAADQLGGLAALQNVQNVVAKMKIVQSTPMGEMTMDAEATMVYPDKICMQMNTPGGEVTIVMTGDDAWMTTPQGTMPAPAPVTHNLKGAMVRDMVTLAKIIDDLKVQYIGENTFCDNTVTELLISHEDQTFSMYIDKTTELPLGVKYNTMGQQGPVDVSEQFLDYREIAGMKLPFKTLAFNKENKISETTTQSVQVDAPVDMGMFARK